MFVGLAVRLFDWVVIWLIILLNELTYSNCLEFLRFRPTDWLTRKSDAKELYLNSAFSWMFIRHCSFLDNAFTPIATLLCPCECGSVETYHDRRLRYNPICRTAVGSQNESFWHNEKRVYFRNLIPIFACDLHKLDIESFDSIDYSTQFWLLFLVRLLICVHCDQSLVSIMWLLI
jgi:hypothetical protein